MSEGTIKRITDKGFGFIQTAKGSDVFFHMSSVEGVSFNELQEGTTRFLRRRHGPQGTAAPKTFVRSERESFVEGSFAR